MRGLLVGVVVTGVALFFTHVPVAHPLLIMGSVLLTSVVFALGGFFNAIFAKNFDQISWFPTFVLTPLIYLGGVFYSVSLLPPWAEKLSYVNPILYMVNAFRHGFLGTSDVDPGVAFVIMGAFAVAMYTIVVRAHEPRHRHPGIGASPCAAATHSSPRPRPCGARSRSTTCPRSSRATTSRRPRTCRPCALARRARAPSRCCTGGSCPSGPRNARSATA